MNDMKLAIQIFNLVRDIPYNIPLKNSDIGYACHGKSVLLYDLLRTYGYTVRFRACNFRWDENIRNESITRLIKKNDAQHTYVEIKVKNNWCVLDASFDTGLKKRLPVNYWDGKTDTKLQVKQYKILTVKESDKILKTVRDPILDVKMHKKNYELYKMLNSIYTNIRAKSKMRSK
jgi:hypothetical protein